METYKVQITHTNGTDTPQYFMAKDILAPTMVDAIRLAIAQFSEEHITHKIKKIVAEVQSSWKATSNAHRGE